MSTNNNQTVLYHIDINQKSPELVPNASKNASFNEYAQDLFEEVLGSSKKKSFNFSSKTTELYTCIQMMLNGNFDDGAQKLAKRLLKIEKSTHEDYSHLKYGVQKGSLILSVLPQSGQISVVIAKTDHVLFIDETNFDKRHGLPVKKKIFKAFCGRFNASTKEAEELFVFDSTYDIARYWWDGFLELSEMHSSNHNTKTLFKSLDKHVLSRFKNSSPGDYLLLRNASISYFRSRDNFDLDNLVDTVFKGYEPYKPDHVNVAKMVAKVRAIPESENCDSQFTIDKSAIGARRYYSKISLADSIELELTDSVEDLKNIIVSFEKDGNKGVFIKTEKGYGYFKQKD